MISNNHKLLTNASEKVQKEMIIENNIIITNATEKVQKEMISKMSEKLQ